jgi:hypothetical protein
MFTRTLVSLAIASAATLAMPSLARADVAEDPCEGAEVGESCDDGFTSGTCQMFDGELECVEGGASTAAATTAAATTAATTGAATTATSSGSGGTGGEGEGGSAGGGETEDDGCTVRAPRGKSATHAGAAAVFAIASAIALARRVRRR